MPVQSTDSPLSELGAPAPVAATRPTGALRLPGNRDSWTFMASPVVLGCLQGEVVPHLAKAWHTPGLGGNSRSPDNAGMGFKAGLEAMGFVAVPHDFPVTAFGQKRDPSAGSTYIQRFESRGVVYHTDAWHRPRVYGHQLRWEFDREGWLKFLVDVRKSPKALGLKSLDDIHIEIATARLLEEVRALQERDDHRARRQLSKRLANLPADLVPSELRAPAREASKAT